jgi:hypothetical protein
MTFNWKNSGGSGTAALSASVATGGAIVQGDFLVVLLDQGGGVVTPPAGWTLIGAANNGSNAVVFWKIAGASEPSSYTFSWASSGTFDWAIASWRGVSGVPIDKSAQSTGSSAGPYVAPSVTPVGSADLLLCLWDVERGGTYTPPAGMTTRLSVVGAGTAYLGISELQLASSAATATESTSGPGTAVFWTTTIALTPSGAAPVVTPFVPTMRQYLRAGATQAPPGIPVVSTASFTVAANPTLDEFVGTVSATNSPTSFAITAGDPGSNFAIYSTGNLRTAPTGTPPAAGNYSLSVTATNATGTSAPATVSVTVSQSGSGTYNNLTNWPDATNRPVLSGSTLSWIGPVGGGPSTANDTPQTRTLTSSGSITTTADGQVIQGLNISGTVTIHHNNVTVKQCAIVGSGADPVIYVPPVGSGSTGQALSTGGFLIEDCYAALASSASGDHIIRMGSGTCRRCYMAHAADIYELTPDSGISPLPGSTTLAIDCYFHFVTSDFISGMHPDTIEGDGNYNNATIQHCNSVNDQNDNSSGTFSGYWGPISNLVLTNNRFIGGNFSIYFGQASGNSAVTNVTITNNRISKGSFGYAANYTVSGALTISGNVDDATGANIDGQL